MALVTAAQVISNLPVHDGLDTEFITPILEVSELSQLEPTMSSGYYANIVASGWMVDGVIDISGYSATVSGTLSLMLSGYVKPFLYWAIGVNALEEIANQVGNAGIYDFTPQQGNSQEKAIQRKINNWQAYKNTYQGRLKQFIIDHESQSGFEGYANNSTTISGDNSMFNLLGMV